MKRKIGKRFPVWLGMVGALVVVLLLTGAAGAAYVLNRFGVGVHGNPLRLIGLVQASFLEGCHPKVNPIACRVAGRAWRVQSSGAPWGVRSDPRDPSSIRFELRAGDKWAKDVRLRELEPDAHDVERVELSDLARQSYGEDIWFAFTMQVEPGPSTTADWVNLGQLHNTPDPGEKSASPPWVQGFGPGDAFRVFVRHTAQDPLRTNPSPVVLFEDRAFRRARAYRFVYHLTLAPTGAGRAQLWRDGVLVADRRGPLGYPDKRGPYFKFGVYRSPAAENMVVRYSDVRLGREPLTP